MPDSSILGGERPQPRAAGRDGAFGSSGSDSDIPPDRITRDPSLARPDGTDTGDDTADTNVADTDEFAVANDAPGESDDPSAERIDVDDDQALNEWAEKLDTTPEQLRDAVDTVGDLAADVEMHLKGTHSTTNADRVEDAGDM